MRFIDDWRWVVNHAWSVRLLLLAAVLTGMETILPLFMDHPPIPRPLFAGVCLVIVVAAMFARFYAQARTPPDA